MRKLINGKNAVCLYEGKYKDVTYHFFVTTFLIFSILNPLLCLFCIDHEPQVHTWFVCLSFL